MSELYLVKSYSVSQKSRGRKPIQGKESYTILSQDKERLVTRETLEELASHCSENQAMRNFLSENRLTTFSAPSVKPKEGIMYDSVKFVDLAYFSIEYQTALLSLG